MNGILHSVSKMGVSCPLGITCSFPARQWTGVYYARYPERKGGEGICAIVKGMVLKQFTLALGI